MNTKDTLHIILNGGADEHVGLLRDGESVVVSVDAKQGRRRLVVSGPLPADHVLKVAMLKKENELLNSRLQAALAENDRLKREKSTLADKVVKSGLADLLTSLAEEQRAAATATRTALEVRCFASPCRVWLIKRDLKGFVASMGSKWQKRDWCIVWKIFSELRWWTGKQKEFAEWVAELGYDMGTFKEAKRGYGDARLGQWHAQYYATGHFAQVARGLAELFTGSPTMPTSSTYEDSHMDHDALYRTMGLSQAGKQGTRAHILIDTPGHDKSIRYRHYKSQRSKENFDMVAMRRKIFGTFGLTQSIPVGMSRRPHAAHTPRARREPTLPRGFYIR